MTNGSNDRTVLRITIEAFVLFTVIAGLPYMLGGVWPPFVSIVSDSMSPNMNEGDLVYIVEIDQTEAEHALDPAMTTNENNFGESGSVIVFQPDGYTDATPIIHRAEFWVERGENWYDKADEQYVAVDSCERLNNCPAPNSGYVTLGDSNPRYDQAAGLTRPVRPTWVVGEAELKIPYVGRVRMFIDNSVNAISSVA